MSHGVHIQVTLPTSQPDRLKLLASESFSEPRGGQLIDECNSHEFIPGASEAYEFLDDLREGHSFWKCGTEGDVFLCGMVGSHSDPVAFAHRLMSFWNRLFESDSQVITQDWQRVLIIYTHSGGEPQSGVLQIGWDDPESPDRRLTISHTPKGSFTFIRETQGEHLLSPD